MGNVALCAPSIISTAEVKVLSTTTGKLAIYRKAPVGAAEVMAESPAQFLCESSSLRVGQRIVGVTAEEELERGRLYYLLPMEMLYSVLTEEEMKAMTYSSKPSTAATTTSFARIFPEFKHCIFPNNDNGSEYKMVNEENSEKVRYSRQRSWQPALETIIETPTHAN